jgi:protein gp37
MKTQITDIPAYTYSEAWANGLRLQQEDNMAKTKIQWATDVWNPSVGCTKVSSGCARCYAETMAKRLKAMGRPEYQDTIGENGRWNGTIQLIKERLDDPLRWKKPRRVFVNSMSDLFHDNVPYAFIDSVFGVMAAAHWHTFMLLTKRPERMWSYLSGVAVDKQLDPTSTNQRWQRSDHWRNIYAVLPNVWLGVSVEDQATADERIPLLLQTPAAVRFVSYEPALGPVNFSEWILPDETHSSHGILTGDSQLDWIIMVGESGPGARPMHPDWARSVRDQCQAAGVPFFFKQWGEWTTVYPKGMRSLAGIQEAYADGEHFYRIGKGSAGRMLDGREWNEFPEATK